MVDVQVLAAALGSSAVISGLGLYVIKSEARKAVARTDRRVTLVDNRVAQVDSRIGAHEAGCVERQKRLDERHATIEKQLAQILRQNENMNGKLDRFAGGGV